MIPRRHARLAAAGLALAVTAAGCSGAATRGRAAIAGAAACDPDHLDACERHIAEALSGDAGGPSRDLVASYFAARSARDPADPWTRAFAAIDAAPRPAALLITDAAPPDSAAKLGAALRVIRADLPAPGAISIEALALAMALVAGHDHVVLARGSRVVELFPRDPLAPFVAGLAPVIRDDGALADLEGDLALARSLRAAIDAAGAYRFVDAAREADRLAALVASRGARDADREPVVRARFALQALAAAGIALDPADDAAPSAPVADAPPAASDTPYGDLLRVRTARDERRAWSDRRAKILAAIPADRQAELASLFAPPSDCAAPRSPPPMDGARDLVFAARLASSLARDPAAPAGQLPLAEWLRRYEALVALVERTHTGWAHAATLLRERGESPGMSPAGTPLYGRVTSIARSVLAATRALEAEFPRRYRAISELALVASPGALLDDALREPSIRLTQASVQHRIEAAPDPEAVFAGVLAGIFAGLSYPPGLAEAHYAALQGAFTAKLRGDLSRATGWGAAGLFAADAAHRIASTKRPDLSLHVAEIARALGDASVRAPELAALATASARYAALAARGRLDPRASKDRLPGDRRAAKAAIRAAISGLGPQGEAPERVLDDLADLADGLFTILGSSLAARPDPAPAACEKPPTVALDAVTRNALAALGDVRQRILSHPRYKRGDGVWARRTRLVMTLLSDAMDLIHAADARDRLVFTIPSEAAEASIDGALRELGDRDAADAIAGAWAVTRSLAAASASAHRPTAEAFFKQNGRDLRRALGGLFALFRGDPARTATGVALLDSLASLGLAGTGGDLGAALTAYAAAFYARGQPDQADLCLLGAIVLSAVTRAPPPRAAVELAKQHRSRLAWALHFASEIHAAKPPDPSAFADGVRGALAASCRAPEADPALAVMQAARDFAAGRRDEARAALDRVLAAADGKGLVVPRIAYRYEEKTATKVLSLTVELSLGGGVLEGGNGFHLGLGVRSRGEPEGSFAAEVMPSDSAAAGEDAARFYISVAALAADYHLLAGDVPRGIAAARRALSALAAGVRLGPRAVLSERPAAWGSDARALLAVAAQLSADAGMPFLAGDLWTATRQALPAGPRADAVLGVLDALPPSIASVDDLAPVIARARRSLAVLAARLPCATDRVDLGRYEAPACDGYPASLALRIADALPKLPRLSRTRVKPGGTKHEDGPWCGAMKSLDAFLGAADRKRYEPDVFTRAVSDLRAAGRSYDAAALVARHKREGHCSPPILAEARALGRAPELGPMGRADMLSAAINCAAAAGGPAVLADVLALDAETRELPDPGRNLQVVLSIADLASRTGDFAMVGELAAQPGFVDRWLGVHPSAATAALLIDHAVSVIRGAPVDSARTKVAFEHLCRTFPPGERAETCKVIASLRAAEGPLPDRRRAAREAVRQLLSGAAEGRKRP